MALAEPKDRKPKGRGIRSRYTGKVLKLEYSL